jgi:hypothetical protein
LNTITTTLDFDDEPDFLGGDIIEDKRARSAARVLSHSFPMGETQSQSQFPFDDFPPSAEIQVPSTNSGDLPRHDRDRLIIEELTQIEDSQPVLLDEISLSEASDSDHEDQDSFSLDTTHLGVVDRAEQKRAGRTVSETGIRFAFKAVCAPSPVRAKRAAVSVIEADDDSRKKVMREVIGAKNITRKAWGARNGRGAVTFQGKKGKENRVAQGKGEGVEKRQREIVMLMDSQDSFC